MDFNKDEGLRELEEYAKDNNQELKINDDEEDIKEIEKSIINIKPKKNDKLTLIEIEEYYHDVNFYFSELIHIEVTKIIPFLKKNFSTNKNFISFLCKKQNLLKEKQDKLLQDVQNGKIDEKGYLKILVKTLEENIKIKKKAEDDKQNIQTLKRIEIRLKKLNEEKEAIYTQMGISKNFTDNEKKKDRGEKIKYSDDEEEVDYNKNIKQKESLSLAILQTKEKTYKSFLNYLNLNFPQKRQNDIIYLQKKLSELSEKIQELEVSKDEIEVSQIESQFPKLDQKFIIGEDRMSRNKKIDKFYKEIYNDIESIRRKNGPKLVSIYNKHYISIMKNLKLIKESSFGIFPELIKKKYVIPFREINNNILKNDLEVKILRLYGVKEKKWNVSFFFNFNNIKFDGKTSFNIENGELNFSKVLKLNWDLNQNFLKSSIYFYLNKTEDFVNVQNLSQICYNLGKFMNYSTIKENIVFPNGISMDIELKINQALGKGKKVIELYNVVKNYPIYNLPGRNKKKQKDKKKKILEEEKKEEEELKKDIDEIVQEKKKEIKFPLISKKNRDILNYAVSKNKISKNIPGFQENVFSITFYEEFIKDLKLQLKKENSDKNEINRLILQSEKYLKSLIEKLQKKNMSVKEYKNLVHKCIERDTENLDIFQKLKFVNEELFVKNRLSILRAEFHNL